MLRGARWWKSFEGRDYTSNRNSLGLRCSLCGSRTTTSVFSNISYVIYSLRVILAPDVLERLEGLVMARLCILEELPQMSFYVFCMLALSI